MKLVEAEAEGPIEGEEAVVTPPRPPHRRVSVSFLFTLTILIGTVVAIYMTFPARNHVLVTEAIEQHRATEAGWDLVAPTAAELRAWTIGVIGKEAAVPGVEVTTIGARQIDVLDRRAAVVRYAIGKDQITFVVQRGRGLAPRDAARTDGDLLALSWRRGPFTCVTVGPAATSAHWSTLLASRC